MTLSPLAYLAILRFMSCAELSACAQSGLVYLLLTTRPLLKRMFFRIVVCEIA